MPLIVHDNVAFIILPAVVHKNSTAVQLSQLSPALDVYMLISAVNLGILTVSVGLTFVGLFSQGIPKIQFFWHHVHLAS